jgi:hypothetical protein
MKAIRQAFFDSPYLALLLVDYKLFNSAKAISVLYRWLETI